MKRKLGVNIDCIGSGFDEVRTLELAHQTGFEVFTGSKRPVEMMARIKEKAVELGMEFPYLHAPYSGINNLWLDVEEYRTIFDGITESVDLAAMFEVGAVVTHVSSGWQAPPVNDLGLSRFDALVEYAEKKGVTLAFENLRMTGNLAYLIDVLHDFRLNVRVNLSTVFVVLSTSFGGDGETLGNGKTDFGHFSKVSTFTAEELAHGAVAFGEKVNILFCAHLMNLHK